MPEPLASTSVPTPQTSRCWTAGARRSALSSSRSASGSGSRPRTHSEHRPRSGERHDAGLTVGAGSGFLGAYTTFSAFAYETRELIREARIALAAGNAVGSVVAVSGLYRRDSTGAGYGAFMESSGRNPWQPVANSSAAKTAQIRETVAVGCDRLPRKCHGKEGRRFESARRLRKSRAQRGFSGRVDLQRLRVRWVWSRL